MKVIVLEAQDGEWSGLYIDGKLIDQGHVLGEGDNFLYMLNMSEEYGFSSKDVSICTLNDEDDENLMNAGDLPENLSSLKGIYP